ncbi:MAG: radical SAM protein [Phycisphaerae bacterium]
MGCQDNPANRLLSEQVEWCEPPPPARLSVREEQARSILSHNESPDIPFRWSVNPYRGCEHACAFCYARRTHEYLDLGAGTDFETLITVKVNAAELLAQALAKPRWKREKIQFSGVTDAYQPLEAKYGITRACLEVCRQRANPVCIVTKSPLVIRDLDILRELHRVAAAYVLFSIPFADAKVARLLAPRVVPPNGQFAAMRRVAEAGLPVGVLISPVIPGLNDRDIPTLLARAAACGATSASFGAVRLPGSVREVFLARLRAGFPQAADRVQQRILDLRGGVWNDPRFGWRMRAEGAYWLSVQRLFETAATRHGLDCGQSWREEFHSPAPPPTPTERQLSLF